MKVTYYGHSCFGHFQVKAVRAAQFVKTKRVVAMHFDTFPFIKIDHDKAVSMFKEKQTELIIPVIGQSFEL
jgi:L-ascorbate metabolism protein UlaG (beta-lactamase superfamily)